MPPLPSSAPSQRRPDGLPVWWSECQRDAQSCPPPRESASGGYGHGQRQVNRVGVSEGLSRRRGRYSYSPHAYGSAA